MGGDEFLAIVRHEHIADVNDALAKMAELQKDLSANLLMPLEAAYGVAYRHELSKDKNVHLQNIAQVDSVKVYQLADERMYAMKSVMKSTLVRL